MGFFNVLPPHRTAWRTSSPRNKLLSYVLAWDVSPSKVAYNERPGRNKDVEVLLAGILLARSLGDGDLKRVGTCDGSNPEHLLKWLRALDTAQNPAETTREAADGPLASYLKKSREENWKKLCASIATHFISAAFPQLLSLQTADEENGIRENAMSSIPSLKNFKATHYKHSMENTLVKCTAAACAQTEIFVFGHTDLIHYHWNNGEKVTGAADLANKLELFEALFNVYYYM
ncbi:hypothetical protein CAPTEDRAFT_211643 [Capitella teleta]|uniref:Uncharacterized protein n=1 Tax=Capitella teleta TaxID=283909 RepID=R7TD18_CAPTE|nr:hypothetical protein CAPTEDRAFT_211643 [Capitella teleta]|eukprot:ELT91624.1 hypothetical protein CAPTEDRAFT_211643 [Capitella teleta]